MLKNKGEEMVYVRKNALMLLERKILKKRCIDYMLCTLVGVSIGACVACTPVESEYKFETYNVSLSKGETIYGIAEKMYNINCGETFNEFYNRVCKDNNKLLNGGRMPQAGDLVIVNLKKEINK